MTISSQAREAAEKCFEVSKLHAPIERIEDIIQTLLNAQREAIIRECAEKATEWHLFSKERTAIALREAICSERKHE